MALKTHWGYEELHNIPLDELLLYAEEIRQLEGS